MSAGKGTDVMCVYLWRHTWHRACVAQQGAHVHMQKQGHARASRPEFSLWRDLLLLLEGSPGGSVGTGGRRIFWHGKAHAIAVR
jgi:hypothetical protein